jgi:hypothetical protein
MSAGINQPVFKPADYENALARQTLLAKHTSRVGSAMVNRQLTMLRQLSEGSA